VVFGLDLLRLGIHQPLRVLPLRHHRAEVTLHHRHSLARLGQLLLGRSERPLRVLEIGVERAVGRVGKVRQIDELFFIVGHCVLGFVGSERFGGRDRGERWP